MRLHRLLPIVAALVAAGPVAPPLHAAAPGVVRADTLWSQALGTRKQFIVWLPPSYASDASRRYPAHQPFARYWRTRPVEIS